MKHLQWAGLFIVGILAGSFGYAIIADDKVGSIKVSVPGAEIDMDLQDGSELAFFDIIEQMFADETAASATKGVLESQYGFFDGNGSELPKRIRDGDPQVAELSKEILLMLEGFQGPFVKSEDFTFRDVTKLETIDEMGDLLGNEHPVARKIQDLCLYSESFCDNPGLLAYITVPGTIRPGSGAVCKTSRLLGENVVLQNPERRDSIVVVTLGSYFGPPCVDREHPDEGKPRVTKENLIQLSEEDQKKLFPDSARGSFLEALTFPNPPGTVSAPVIPDIADVSAGSDGVAPALAEPIYIRAN